MQVAGDPKRQPPWVGRLAWSLAIWLVVQLPGSAATIVVDSATGLDTGTCSLAEAIQNANSGALNADCAAGDPGADTIELTVNVELFAPLPNVTSEVVLEGNGFTVKRSDAASKFSVFRVVGGGDLSLFHTAVSNGIAPLGAARVGGGIYNDSGTLLLSHSTVSDNFARDAGGGIANLSGTLTLSNSTVSNNRLDQLTGDAKGGGIYNVGGAVTLTDSTVSENYISANSSSADTAFGGGIHNAGGSLTISNSTVVANTAYGYYDSFGAGVHVDSGTVSLLSSTISGNDVRTENSEAGSGLSVHGGSVSLVNSTVSSNTGAEGIYTKQGGVVTLTNSTVFNNLQYNLVNSGSTSLRDTLIGQSVAASPNCFNGGSLVDEGGNLATDSSCGTSFILTGVDPVLADNGGPTQTHALLPGSNAVDFAGACAVPVDQRANPREVGACDAGAFELSCYAPDGAYLLLEMGSVASPELYEACWRITAGNDYFVFLPGQLTLRSGREVVFGNGFEMFSGGLIVEIDPSLQMAPRPKVVFVTSDTFPGGVLGGLAAADAHCNNLAAASGRSGSFKAWLSDSTCAVADACRGFTQATVPYVRPDGVRVADDWSDLIDGQIQAPIFIDESGNDRRASNGTGKPVWTGTNPNGTLWTNGHCSDWASIASSGRQGWLSAANSEWSTRQSKTCNLSARLYCFEQ